MPAGWNRCGVLSEKPAGGMSLKEARAEVMKLRLRVMTLYGDLDRGRPLTDAEKLRNLETGSGMVPGSLTNG
jgi:hypothetical protein